MSFDKIIEDFKDLADLQKYSEAQFKTIIELNKKLIKAEEEIKGLKLLLEQSSPLLVSDQRNVVVLEVGTDQEIIAQVQLRLLKEISYERDLTFEEAKKVETYTKILSTMQSIKPKAIEVNAKDFGDKELLKLVGKSDDKT